MINKKYTLNGEVMEHMLKPADCIRWNDRSMEVVFIDGKAVALAGWNGEAWLDCRTLKTVSDTAYDYENEKKIKVRPVYKQVDENAFEIAEYEIV